MDVEIKHTSPYHLQTNGMVERMHSTLENILRKASTSKVDWVEQVPFALFALRQMPCKTAGFSPYEMVWGRTMRTPLDVVYCGWREKRCRKMNVCEWVDERLSEKLELMRDCMVDMGVSESEKIGSVHMTIKGRWKEH